MQTDDVARFIGTDTRTEWVPLRCGPLALHFDPTVGALRNIRLGAREVVRALYVAVRDGNWGTVAPQIADITLTTANDGFCLAFVAECREREIDFRWQGRIVGEANGSLRFDMEGEALSAFRRNRIGFCVLHPIRECAGQPCLVTTADGALEEGRFPVLIAPHQPFRNLRAIRQEVLPGTWAELAFAGDIFEMEDQRNWSDASFKTYGTPLSLPYPVEVPQGTRISQSVSLNWMGEPHRPLPVSGGEDEAVTLTLTAAPPLRLPEIGLCVASHGAPLSHREFERLSMLGLSHLRLDLALTEPGWKAQLHRAAHEAATLGVKLEIALFLADDALEAQLAALAEQLKYLHPGVRRWLIFHARQKVTPERCARVARTVLAPLTPDAPFGGGTNANFAELNRSRPPREALDCVCWSINPQVHAFDTATLMENLEAQAETVRSARAIYGDLPIVISPVTLKPRFNPDATTAEAPTLPGELPPQVDARQCTLMGAAWTLGSLKQLCESGVQSVTYYETTGWRGMMEMQAGSPLPQRFPSVAGEVFPLHRVFADFSAAGALPGGNLLALASNAPLKVDGIALDLGAYHLVLCANLTPTPQTVRLLFPTEIGDASVWQLSAATVRAYMSDPARSFKEANTKANKNANKEANELVEVRNRMIERTLPPFAYVGLSYLKSSRSGITNGR